VPHEGNEILILDWDKAVEVAEVLLSVSGWLRQIRDDDFLIRYSLE